MPIKPIVPPNIELRCKKNGDGSINAGGYDDGQQLLDPKYHIQNGTCDDVNRLYKDLSRAYPGVPINVGSDCSHCIKFDEV